MKQSVRRVTLIAFRHRLRRVGFARMAQEKESANSQLRTGGTPMSKSAVAIVLTLIALAFAPAEALAYPISVADAQKCGGHWHTTATGAQVCIYCEWWGKRTACHWIVCDSTGCDQTDVSEIKLPPRQVRVPTGGYVTSNPPWRNAPWIFPSAR
jgi:hypothetical protein